MEIGDTSGTQCFSRFTSIQTATDSQLKKMSCYGIKHKKTSTVEIHHQYDDNVSGIVVYFYVS